MLGGVELDPLSADTYRVNHPDATVWLADIRRLPASELKNFFGLREGDLDLLAGCPPCQGFSSVRTLNGSRRIEDPRNDLVFEFLRFVKDLKPKVVMMENVPGLALDPRIEVFWKELQDLGYQGGYKVLDAADYGVPQRRRRMMLLASRTGDVGFAPKDPARRKLRDVIAALPKAGESGDPLHDLPPARRTDRIATLISRIPKDGGSRMSLGTEHQLACHKKCRGFKDVYGRMAWDEVAPTITGGCFNPSKGRFLHPEEDRAITLREAALLQSFPSGYFFSLRRGKTPAAEMIGNALPPEFVRHHARRVMECLTDGKVDESCR